MTKKILSKILFTILAVLILVPFVNAFTEDFQVSGQSEVTVSDCVSSEAGIIKITNIGNIPSGYSLSVSGSAANFISLGPINFVLEPGQSQDILSYLTIPCGAEKEYDLKIHISTVLDTKKVLEQKIFVEKVRNIGLLPIEYSKRIKPCGTASYTYNLTNKGSFDETYFIVFQEPLGKYANVNFNQITLASGQTTSLKIYMALSCDIYGNYTVPFTVKTLNTKTFAKTFAYLLVDREYDYSLKLGNSYFYDKNLSETIFVEKNKDEIYSLCENSRNIIPIKIKNNADMPNSYSLKLINAPNWVKLSDSSISLNKSEEKTLKLNVNTSNIGGDLIIGINSISQLGDLSKTKNISLSVENCYGPNILDSKKPIIVHYNSTKSHLILENKGTKTANYALSLKGAEWIGVEPSTLNVESGKTAKIYIVSNPSKSTATGSYETELQLKAANTNIVYNVPIKVKLTGVGFLNQLYYSFILPYLWYLITALALLIVLLVLLIILAVKKGKRKKGITEKTAVLNKKSEKRISPKTKKTIGWILLVLLLALLAALLYIFWDKVPYVNSLFNQTINQTKIEQTQPTKSFMTTLKEWIVPVKEFFADYWLYFVIGLVALILIIIIIFLVRWIKHSGIIQSFNRRRSLRLARKKAVAEKEQKKPLKLRINKKILWIILALLVLFGLGYLIYSMWGGQIFSLYENFTKNINQTKANITHVKPVEPIVNITETNLTKEPSFLYSTLGNIKNFFMDYWLYFLYGIIALILLLLLVLLIRKLRKRNTIFYEVDHADKEIVLRNNKFACGEIIIKLKRLVYNISFLLKRTKKPTFVGAGDVVYEYFELSKENLDDSDISEIILRFKVKKSWLNRNNIKKADVSLRRYHNKWVGVNTTLIGEDKKYYYYESDINQPAFGYFAIVGKKTEQKEKAVFINKESPKQKKFNFGIFKKIFWWLILVLIIAGIIFLIWHFWKVIVDLIKIYMFYIISAIVLLVLVFLIYPIIRWLKQLGSKSKKMLLMLILILITLILLALLGYGIYYLFSHLSFNFDMNQLLIQSKNDSNLNITPEELPLELNQTLDEPLVEEETNLGIPNQEWYENTNLTIDLSQYFSDPDRDKLYYTNTELQNIATYYQNDYVTLKPEKNWIGSEFVIFTADDMKGGKVDSNIVKLTVKAQAEPTFLFILSSYRPWKPANKTSEKDSY